MLSTQEDDTYTKEAEDNEMEAKERAAKDEEETQDETENRGDEMRRAYQSKATQAQIRNKTIIEEKRHKRR